MNLSRALLLSLALHLAPLLALLSAGQGGQLPGTTGTPAPRLNMSLEQRPEPRAAAPNQRASHSVAAKKEVPQAPAAPATPKAAAGGDAGAPTQSHSPTYYYPTAELSRRATLASQIDMSFVDKVTNPGQAIVILFIGAEGRVDEVKIEASNLSADVESQLRQQFADARFQPAERGGRSVRSRMQIEVFLGEPPAGTPAPPGPTSQSQ